MNGAPVRVLVVEDQPDVASAMRDVVEAAGTATVVAVCGTLDVATQMVERLHPDVVLTDFRLPDGDAVDLFAAWFAAVEGVRIVVASAWSDERSVRRASVAGAHAYLEKGRGLLDLPDVLASVARGASMWPESRRQHAAPSAPSRGAEADVLDGVLAGRATSEIAADLGLAPIEVRRHVNRLIREHGVRTRADLRRSCSSPG